MIYNYILEKFEYGEPIFFSELPGKSKDYLRQQIKKLVDNGNLERLYNGVYYLPYTTIGVFRFSLPFSKFSSSIFLVISPI